MSVPPSAFTDLFRECSVTELTALMRALSHELLDRLQVAARTDAPTPVLPLVRLRQVFRDDGSTDALVKMLTDPRPIPKKSATPRIRVVRDEERPKRMQWNEATQSWG